MLVGVDITKPLADYRLLQILGFLSLILIALVIVTSFLISTFVVSRTNRIANTARQMMETGDLTRRIEIDSRWDDLSNMSQVLNLFLARQEDLVRGIRQVSDNIAHDLRTPLTRLRNDLDRLQFETAGNETAQSRVDTMIQDTEALLGLFNSLLRIARLETARPTTIFSTVDVAEVLQDVCELYEPLAEASGITLTRTLLPAGISGDKDLLFQIFANLVDNAIKYTPAGGQITVQCLSGNGAVSVCISDTGPGIPPEQRDKVFQRFYRLEQSRTSPGHGLGLSLVKAALEWHGGQIVLSDAAPGLRVTLRFPAVG